MLSYDEQELKKLKFLVIWDLLAEKRLNRVISYTGSSK